MRITNYKSNQTLVETTEFTAHLSYGVPQVVVFHRGSALENTVIHNSVKYSTTTSKHKNVRKRCLQTLEFAV